VMGWANFFLVTTVVTAPALLLLIWIERRSPKPVDQESPVPVATR
jgi:hypothetical protein